MYVGGTKNEATAQEEDCPVTVSFANDTWPTIIAAIQSGDYPYQVGDTKEEKLKNNLGTHTLRIANTSSCSKYTLSSQTACGFVLEFADVITTHNMNSTSTNAGGFPASSMYSYLNVVEGTEGSGTIYNALPDELKNAIIDTKVISSHGSAETSNFTTEGVSTSSYSGAIKKLNGEAKWW